MTEQVRNFSMRVAEGIDRRRFLRRTAGSVFATASVLSIGRLLRPAVAYGYTSYCYSPGSGCPYGCGPSTCCNSRSGGCDCSAAAAGCKSGTTNCHGKANTWGGDACWTCEYYRCTSNHLYQIITTCCDCVTSGCGDSSGHCISYQTQVFFVGACGLKPTTRELVGVQTGEPSTSWGLDPMGRSLK